MAETKSPHSRRLIRGRGAGVVRLPTPVLKKGDEVTSFAADDVVTSRSADYMYVTFLESVASPSHACQFLSYLTIVY